MNILVINCGSSSIKGAVIEHKSGKHLVDVKIERIGEAQATIRLNGGEPVSCAGADHGQALEACLPRLAELLPEGVQIEAVGHRVVHGGERFSEPTVIDDAVEAAIEELTPLVPLHNPANLAGIRAARRLLADVPQIAVFDTAFHATLPRRARLYALPEDVAQEHGLRRYGFHGVSHRYVASRAADYLDADVRDLRLITCHMGNGASVCAIEYGRSVETSMGMTALEGLVMGTRVGDLDPGIIIHLMRSGMDVDEIDHLLNRRSGLAGLSGVGNDMRDIEARASDGDEKCRTAIQVFTHRVRKYIGAYAALMGGLDAIVFTGGIGENSETVRHRIAQRLDFLGARLDEERNRAAKVSFDQPVYDIATRNSRTPLLVVATDEARAIARDTARVVLELYQTRQTELTIPVAVSARHVHLTQESVEALFGPGHTLTPRNPLSQPGQFACEETVDIIGPKRTIERVRVLGPARSRNQVEISRTDEFTLGVDAPIRASGDVANSPGVKLIGAAGELELKQGLICAWRHIHMTPDDAQAFGVEDRDVVEVAVDNGKGRSLVFGDVLVRVSPKYKLEMHIDTDEGNAAELGRGDAGALIASTGLATLRRRRTRYDRVED